MDLEADNAKCSFGREPHHISKIGIQRHEHSAVLDSESQDIFVGRAGEANLQDRESIVAIRS